MKKILKKTKERKRYLRKIMMMMRIKNGINFLI